MKMRSALLVAALALAGAARANDVQSLHRRFRVELGVGILSAQSGRDFLGKTPFALGLGYDLGRVAGGTWGLYVSGIYYNRGVLDDRSVFTTTERDSSGFGLQYRSRPTRHGFYIGGGLASYTLSSSVSSDLGNIVTTTTSEDTAWGGKIFVGKNLTGQFFLEAGYTHINAVRLSNGPKRNVSHGTVFLGFRQ